MRRISALTRTISISGHKHFRLCSCAALPFGRKSTLSGLPGRARHAATANKLPPCPGGRAETQLRCTLLHSAKAQQLFAAPLFLFLCFDKTHFPPRLYCRRAASNIKTTCVTALDFAFLGQLGMSLFSRGALQSKPPARRIGGKLSGQYRDRQAGWAERPLPALQHVGDRRVDGTGHFVKPMLCRQIRICKSPAGDCAAGAADFSRYCRRRGAQRKLDILPQPRKTISFQKIDNFFCAATFQRFVLTCFCKRLHQLLVQQCADDYAGLPFGCQRRISQCGAGNFVSRICEVFFHPFRERRLPFCRSFRPVRQHTESPKARSIKGVRPAFAREVRRRKSRSQKYRQNRISALCSSNGRAFSLDLRCLRANQLPVQRLRVRCPNQFTVPHLAPI